MAERLVAQDLAARLEQRNRFINRANTRPRIFMICSAEALPIAKSIRVGLSHDADIEIWSDDMIFPAGGYPIEALEEQVNAVAPPAANDAPAESSETRSPCPCCGGHMVVNEILERRYQSRAPPKPFTASGRQAL